MYTSNDQLQRYRWRHHNKSSNVLHRTGKRQRLGAPRARYNNHVSSLTIYQMLLENQYIELTFL